MQESINSRQTPDVESPTLVEIEEAARELAGQILTTPVIEVPWRMHSQNAAASATIHLKLEIFQRTGSFKVRAALLNCLRLSSQERVGGVVAASAGNHAIAVAYAARSLGMSSKLVMFGKPNSLRKDICIGLGAELIIASSPADAFERAANVSRNEGRALIPPYEGPVVALGTATIGLELCNQAPRLDAVVVPIGGGGLAAGVSSAIKLWWPDCNVYGVEPTGAASMCRSFEANAPQSVQHIQTIADSLGAPGAMPYSFGLCRKYLNSVETVSDDELLHAMRVMAEDWKLAVEPAAAAPLAAMMGPLRDRLKGARVGLIVSGSNIDAATFARLLDLGSGRQTDQRSAF